MTSWIGAGETTGHFRLESSGDLWSIGSVEAYRLANLTEVSLARFNLLFRCVEFSDDR